MTSADSVTSVSTEPTVLPGWTNLAAYGEPNTFHKVDDLDLRADRFTRSVKILITPGSKETSPAETRSLIMKQLLKTMIGDLNTDFGCEVNTGFPGGFRASPGIDRDEFKAILHSRAGGAHHGRIQHVRETYSGSMDPDEELIESVASFMFVSPDDDWPYVCFAATCAERGYQTVSTIDTTSTKSRKDYHKKTVATMLVHASDDRVDIDDAEYAVIYEYLGRHIDQTLNKLDNLISIVENIEQVVQGVTDDTMLADPIKQLHLCNVQHVRLQRRWAFQKQLMVTVDEILSGDHVSLLGISEPLDSVKMKQVMSYRTRIVQAAETDLAVLPRRIENQFTALYNLSNQRDAKASVKIATESAQIAQATLNDSSSMKTIAVMTLIFLPATFACSFFSMTFFNWQSASNRTVSTYLWVYFAVTVPIAFLVLAAWAFLTKKNRQGNSARVGISQLLRRRTMERGQDLEKND